jgi:hypothetical protein
MDAEAEDLKEFFEERAAILDRRWPGEARGRAGGRADHDGLRPEQGASVVESAIGPLGLSRAARSGARPAGVGSPGADAIILRAQVAWGVACPPV